jgi:hypothetical protein
LKALTTAAGCLLAVRSNAGGRFRNAAAAVIGLGQTARVLAQHALHEPRAGSPLAVLAILTLTLGFAAGWPLSCCARCTRRAGSPLTRGAALRCTTRGG